MKDFWFKLDDKLRFLLVGGFNFCVSYVIYSCLCLAIGEGKFQIALVLSWIISSVISFTTQKNLVFKGGEKWFKEYCKCCSTWIFSYIINAVLLEIIVKYVGLNVYFGQILAVSVAAVFTYIMFKKFAFKN